MDFFTTILFPVFRDSIIGKLIDMLIDWIYRIFKKNRHGKNEKYAHCKSYKELLTSAITDITNITKTDYNQIILCVNSDSHALALLVCADKIAPGKQKYRIVANDGLIALCFHKGHYIRMTKVGENPKYYMAVGETKSELVVPIQIADNKLGVINSESTEEYHYTNKMLKELTAIAHSMCTRLVEMHFDGNAQEIPYVSL